MRRMIWFGMGVGSTIWVRRTVKRKAEQYVPEYVTTKVKIKARQVGRDVKSAVAEGRRAMHEYQADAKADLEASARRSQFRAVSGE